MITFIQIIIVAGMAQYVAINQPLGVYSLGVFYATMVLATALPVYKSKSTAFALMYPLMATAYLIDEWASWQAPELVMAFGAFAGAAIFIICNMEGSKANKYIGSVLVLNAALGFVQFFVAPLSMAQFATLHNFIAIVAWIWMANMAFDRRGYVTENKKDKLFNLKVAAFDLWMQVLTKSPRQLREIRKE